MPCGCSAQVAILRQQDFRPTWSVLVKCCHAIIGYSEGGGESQGRYPWAFIRVVLFRVDDSSTWLLTIDIWDRWAGQSRKWRLLQTTISERASQTSGMGRKVKVWFFYNFVLQIEVLGFFGDYPWRLPSDCLVRGRYGTTSPKVGPRLLPVRVEKCICLFYCFSVRHAQWILCSADGYVKCYV